MVFALGFICGAAVAALADRMKDSEAFSLLRVTLTREAAPGAAAASAKAEEAEQVRAVGTGGNAA